MSVKMLCSLCGKPPDEVKTLVAGDEGGICDECVLGALGAVLVGRKLRDIERRLDVLEKTDTEPKP